MSGSGKSSIPSTRQLRVTAETFDLENLSPFQQAVMRQIIWPMAYLGKSTADVSKEIRIAESLVIASLNEMLRELKGSE